jgi:toxin YoeB
MVRELIFESKALEQFDYWKKTNGKVVVKIKNLINDILEHPFTGIGKPEPLKGSYSGFWSRRINKGHRLVYAVNNDSIIIAQCRYHYAP